MSRYNMIASINFLQYHASKELGHSSGSAGMSHRYRLENLHDKAANSLGLVEAELPNERNVFQQCDGVNNSVEIMKVGRMLLPRCNTASSIRRPHYRATLVSVKDRDINEGTTTSNRDAVLKECARRSIFLLRMPAMSGQPHPQKAP